MIRKLLALAGLMLVIASVALAQPDGGKRNTGDKKGGDKKGPPGFELGKVLPPFVLDQLELTNDQKQKIRDLEMEVRGKLEGILTQDQIKAIREMRKKDSDGQGPPRKEGGAGGKNEKPPESKLPYPQRQPNDTQTKVEWDGGGIQWFGAWKQGLAEAQRTGRPILLVSAAPHCSGVSGVW